MKPPRYSVNVSASETCREGDDWVLSHSGLRMRRREFITLLAGAAAWPVAARAQQERMPRIGVLMGLSESDSEGPPRVAAFKQELQNLGWTEGRNLQIEYRWGAGDADHMGNSAAELAGTMPDVLVAHLTAATRALMLQTRTIPIIFVVATDPVGRGLVASLSRPGGNVTGFSNFVPSLGGKWIELLKELSPRIKRVALLFNPEVAAGGGSFYSQPVQAAASTLAVESTLAVARNATEIEEALAKLARDAECGLIVLPGLFTTNHRELIVELAARHRLPAIYPFRYFATGGGLMSYGIDIVDLFRRAAGYVDKVLRGANPGELPVQQPEKFEFAINLKTARALNLTVPRILLARADMLID
jgi:putative ABC transport system substrate-binding protein